MNHIYFTGIFSLIVQFITGIIDFYAINLDIPAAFTLIRELLIMELIVQIVEFSFYVWMLLNFHLNTNIRYL